MDLSEFMDKVISKKNKKITDEVFLLIQNDKELMQGYLALVNKAKRGHTDVNMLIGGIVKKKYGLTDDERNDNPESTLISSYQEYK